MLLLALGLAGSGIAGASAAGAESVDAPPPPLGWSSGSRFGCEVSDQLVRETADAMLSSGMKSAGYQYVIVDDCWQSGRDAAGNLVADAQRFPSGMKALANYVHARGLKFGLYADAADFTCQRRPGSSAGNGSGGNGNEQRDASQFAAWGVDVLRYDWCAAGAWKDPDLPPVGKDGGNADEYRALIGLWAVLAAPLIAGNDLRSMDAATRGVLVNRQVIAVNQDELGAHGRRLRRDGDLDIWVRPLSDGAYAILMLNRGGSEQASTVNWTELGLPPRGSLLLRDLWSGRNIGRIRGSYSATLAPHASLLVRATP